MHSDATILIVMQETTAFMDMSLAVKAGVQWGLFGGSVASLGTEKHFHMLDKCQTLEVRGCFALTELGTRQLHASACVTLTNRSGTMIRPR